METWPWLGVTERQALQFFFEHLKDVSDADHPPEAELLYNASVLAHFATTSTGSTDAFPAAPSNLTAVLDVFVLDRSQHRDPAIMEAAASQILILTGFFADQSRRRHNLTWFAAMGAGFYDQAASHGADHKRARLMEAMADHFDYWRSRHHRLARELRDQPRLISAVRAVGGDLN